MIEADKQLNVPKDPDGAIMARHGAVATAGICNRMHNEKRATVDKIASDIFYSACALMIHEGEEEFLSALNSVLPPEISEEDLVAHPLATHVIIPLYASDVREVLGKPSQ